MNISSTRIFLLLPAALSVCSTFAQITHRPPAVPLVTNDPYFSLWSMGDSLTSVPTKHWTEASQPMNGLVVVDGVAYRWMGTQQRNSTKNAPELRQKAIVVTPLHSKYTFEGAGIRLDATFMTPLFPHDLDVISREVTYLTWSVASVDDKEHKVDILLDVDPAIGVNDVSQPVTWSRFHHDGLTLLNTGTRDQNVLNRAGDKIRADWGYFHLGIPDAAHATSELSTAGLEEFLTEGALKDADQLQMPLPVQQSGRPAAAHLSALVPFDKVNSTPQQKHVLLAYTQVYAIEYLGQRLKPYWARNGMTEGAMISQAEREYTALEARAKRLDEDLIVDMKRIGGEDYAYLGSLLFRQTMAAHKLVADYTGTPMYFSKENASNGCIDTVDVTYPSAPFFLLFNPELLKAQLEPVMRYAALPRWHFPFAPHDLGTYPLGNGQVYGGRESSEEDQMPVEESANLILLVGALAKAEGNFDFARKYMAQLTQWAGYLAAKGLDPEKQLSTDDFAGHLAHNTNLSIKAIEALGAFVQIARGVGDTALAAKYSAIVSKMPAEWERMAREGDHYRLAFDQPNTWSQKYNLVWDDLLDLHLFSPAIAATEWTFYAGQMKPYGLPLDSRKTYTKLDWELWTATLTHDSQQFQDLVHRLVSWADNTPSRVPTTDWYDTVDGTQMGFQARSVVGGVFIKALADQQIAKRWQTDGLRGETVKR